MSHFAVLVIIENALEQMPDIIPGEVDKLLAPFMENCCDEPDKMYMKFYDEEDEYLKQYEEGGQEKVVMPDGRLLLPWDEEFRKEWKEGDNPLDKFNQPKAPPELPRKVIPFKETYSTFEEFVAGYCGHKERDETYLRYGYWQNGSKYIVEVCLGNETQILQGMPAAQARDVILSGKTKSGGWDYGLPILPVQTMRQEVSPGSSGWLAQKMALEGEIRDYLERLRATPETTERIMSDLFSPSGKQESGSGPRSQIGTGSCPALQSLQYTFGDGSRQYRAVGCSNKLPHKAHIIGTESAGGAKWDWFEIGGRWAGFFQLKPGHIGGLGKQYNFTGELGESNDKADVCFKNAIDFDAMRKVSEDAAARIYDHIHKIIEGTPEAESWESVRSEFDLNKEEESNKARKKYNSQPRVKAFTEYARSEEGWKSLGWMDQVESFQVPREQYLSNARNSAAVPFAILKDGKWIERGDMGYWGMVSNEKDPETWCAMVQKMYDELPEQTLMVIVDCHI